MYGLGDDPVMIFQDGVIRRRAPPVLHAYVPPVKTPPVLHAATPRPPTVPVLAPEDTGPPPEPETNRTPLYIAVGGVAVLGVLYLVMRK